VGATLGPQAVLAISKMTIITNMGRKREVFILPPGRKYFAFEIKIKFEKVYHRINFYNMNTFRLSTL
jgi:hypothetical protein